MVGRVISWVAALAVGLVVSVAAQAASLRASYGFNGTLAADQAGAPALMAIDPLSQNGFETAVVHGVSRTVYRWSGDGSDALRQAGLALDASSLLPDYASYSVALTFEFATTAQTGSGWRRIVDTEARQSDAGFYVSPEQKLQTVQIYATDNVLVSGNTSFTTPGFHDVLLSVAPEAGRQRVTAYLDGQLEISTLTDTFTLANANNPQHLLTFFADNVASNAQQEFASGRIASLVLFDAAVTPAAVPEPQVVLLWLAGLLLVPAAARARRR
ncbi:hypothetical protein [Pelomonas cellulosilytica]|uniref:PEP-CTERM protein-sorting domain-containing protein n=1 Tax=Pelomonas cellulosilytica TaxID=2906762 RepID=A0ABS8Y1I7_9BURK|nr:hypothetical protein [Pelomonas sp. P8]MCE4555645.1 hypothetical protein [Pelomonas sp. P8]